MSVRQYIGARYVPLFMGEWDITKNYEPLSIVQYQGNSYTSRQAVPAGIQITNETFWALTGNYNAQIEAYRQIVMTFNDRITTNENDIDSLQDSVEDFSDSLAEYWTALGFVSEKADQNELDISEMKKELYVDMFDGSNEDNFTVRIAHNDEFAVMFDTGSSNDTESILSFCESINVSHLDALVITHFHNDHAGNMSGIINSSIVDETTKIYIQMSPTVGNDQYSLYETNKGSLDFILQTNNYPNAIVPNDNTAVNIGSSSAKMTFWNTNPNNKYDYDTVSWANNGTTDHRTSSLNNYSLITRIDVNNSSYVDTGDIEGMAQSFYAQYMNKCNVMLNPHHFANKMGYEEFFNKLNPDYILVANHFITGETDINAVSVYNYRFSYLFRYLLYNSFDTLIVTNVDKNCHFKIHDGTVIEFDGYIMDTTFDPEGVNAQALPYSALLPPDIYKNNPYWLLSDEFTIEELIKIFRQHNTSTCPNGFYFHAANSSSGWANSPICQALRGLWLPYVMNNQIELTYPSRNNKIQLSYGAFNAPYNGIELFSATGNNAEYAFLPANRMRHGYSQILEANIADGDTLDVTTYPQWGYMRLADAIQVTLSGGTHIGLQRKNGFTDSQAFNGIFDGMTFNSTHTVIYHVLIAYNGSVSINEVILATGEVTHNQTIAKMKVIY